MTMKKGDTIFFENCPYITGFATVGGKKESEGPLAQDFDSLCIDTSFGEDSWEKSESAFQRSAIEKAMVKANISLEDIDFVFAGDLQSQCTASAYTMRNLDAQFIGIYGACSTMAESLALSSAMVSGNMADTTLAFTSSHFCSAERQFRTPLDYGGFRTPTSQWTVTASGAVILSRKKANFNICVKSATIGRVRDYLVTDINNMGAAMAPAAAQTLINFFKDSGKRPMDFDHIYTGDLGAVGTDLFYKVLEQDGIALPNHSDCGLMIYDRIRQNVDAGASGCGCSAAVLCAEILPSVNRGAMKNVLFISTGALMSTIVSQQGESIPGIAHLVHLAHEK